MFSLIITIISIALVAALTLATIYYGGAAFNKGSAQANAAKIANQSQQLLGAVQMYRADHGAWPASLAVLVSENYLKTIPVAFRDGGAVPTAHAAEQAWGMPVAGNPTFVLRNAVDVDTCRETNLKLLGNDGILKQAYAVYRAQCFGESKQALSVVVTAEPLALSAALGVGEATSDTPPATGGGAPDSWLVEPGETNLGGSGGDSGGDPPAAEIGTPITPVTDTGSMRWDSDTPVVPRIGTNDTFYFWVSDGTWSTEGLSGTLNFPGATATVSFSYCEDGNCRGSLEVAALPSAPTYAPGTVVNGSLTVTSALGALQIPVRYVVPNALKDDLLIVQVTYDGSTNLTITKYDGQWFPEWMGLRFGVSTLYIGQATINGSVCNHYGYQTENVVLTASTESVVATNLTPSTCVTDKPNTIYGVSLVVADTGGLAAMSNVPEFGEAVETNNWTQGARSYCATVIRGSRAGPYNDPLSNGTLSKVGACDSTMTREAVAARMGG